MEDKERVDRVENAESQTAEAQLEKTEKQVEVDRRLRKHGYDGIPKTPSTEDRTAVLGPDDTLPGSGPNHPEDV